MTEITATQPLPISNVQHMYTFQKGFFQGSKMNNSLHALIYAKNAHINQSRKSGEPYFIHPLTISAHAISLNQSDNIVAACLLHDVLEDCDRSYDDLPVTDDVKNIVRLLTFSVCDGETKDEALTRYYTQISQNHDALIVKLLDRVHNLSTLYSFSREKMVNYLEETKTYIFPLLQILKQYPEDSGLLFVIKYQLCAVYNAFDQTLQLDSKSA